MFYLFKFYKDLHPQILRISPPLKIISQSLTPPSKPTSREDLTDMTKKLRKKRFASSSDLEGNYIGILSKKTQEDI